MSLFGYVPPNCDICGRFVSPRQPGASWVFVPGIEVPGAYEEDRWRCARCTAAYGRLRPRQNVKEKLCCGVNPAPPADIPLETP